MKPKERIAIIDGVRTPQAKAGGALAGVSADDLGAQVVQEAILRSKIKLESVDEVIIGNVAQPANAANIGRVVALKAGLPNHVPAITVHRNCASGMEAITTGASRLLLGESEIIVAGGTESMSNIPLLYSKPMTNFFYGLMKAKSIGQKLGALSKFRLRYLKPVIGVTEGLTDPVSGLIMGLTAENLAREFNIDRATQDQFALESHQKAVAARKADRLKDEILPISIPPKFKTLLAQDDGPRENQSMEALAKLRPYFDRKRGTVTVGNACPITDGAAAVVLMLESKAKSLGLKPLGFMSGWAYAGLEPERMGLGPVYATSKLLNTTGLKMSDYDLVELNEAFASQVLANVAAFDSDAFAKAHLGQESKVGTLNPDILNVNGGAIALGHPVGATGTRLVITILKELHRRNLKRGLATLCVGGGQGAALTLETQ